MTGTTTAVRTSRTPKGLRLVRSELQKIRTVNLWWIFALVVLATTGLTLLFNMIGASFLLDDMDTVLDTPGLTEQERQQVLAQAELPVISADLYTSGQFLNLLIVLVMGVLTVTGEFHHKTASTTFLATPYRTAAMVAKAVATSVLAAGYWAWSTAVNIPATVVFLQARGHESYLADPEVVRAILLNLAAYVLWAVLGVGFGVLLRSQVAAVVTGIVLYFAAPIGGMLIFDTLARWLNADWIRELLVIIPSFASQLMVAGAELPGNPPRWVGAATLIGWAVVAGAAGVLATRRRDVT